MDFLRVAEALEEFVPVAHEATPKAYIGRTSIYLYSTGVPTVVHKTNAVRRQHIFREGVAFEPLPPGL